MTTSSISVTNVVASAFPQFDPYGTIRRCLQKWKADETSKYYGLLQSMTGESDAVMTCAIKQLWDANAEKARKTGVAIHSAMEAMVAGSSGSAAVPAAAVRWWEHERHTATDAKTEEAVTATVLAAGTTAIRLSGRIDFQYTSTTDGLLHLVDWKVFESLPDFSREFTCKLVEGLVMPDCKLSKAAVQLNLYRMMLEKTGEDVVMEIVVISPQADVYETFDVPLIEDNLLLSLVASAVKKKKTTAPLR